MVMLTCVGGSTAIEVAVNFKSMISGILELFLGICVIVTRTRHMFSVLVEIRSD